MEHDPGRLLGEVAGSKPSSPVLLAAATDRIPLQGRRDVTEAGHSVPERERGIPAKITALDPPREHIPRERDAPRRRPEGTKPRPELRAEGQRLHDHEPGEQEYAPEATPPRCRRSGDVLSTWTELWPARSSRHPVDMELACPVVVREVPSTRWKVGEARAPRTSSEDQPCRRRRGSLGREKKERRGRPGGVGLIHGARLLLKQVACQPGAERISTVHGGRRATDCNPEIIGDKGAMRG
jgi:hypothetical protein